MLHMQATNGLGGGGGTAVTPAITPPAAGTAAAAAAGVSTPPKSQDEAKFPGLDNMEAGSGKIEAVGGGRAGGGGRYSVCAWP